MINLTIPIHNEETSLRKKIKNIENFLLTRKYAKEVFIVLADNASTDSTEKICKQLKKESRFFLNYFYSPIKGKGNAIRSSWMKHRATQYWFMDLDLSTNLDHLDDLYVQLQQYDIVIGSRLLPESRVTRCLIRETTSRGYNFLLDLFFQKTFSDAQCGFKGVNQIIIDNILPMTRSNRYFFDSELLLLSQRYEYKIGEIPVTWREDPHTHVRLLSVIPYFIKSMFNFHKRLKTLTNKVNPNRKNDL